MIAIMQPYFFPYMGYFQLIHCVDKYINLDHVSFMKRSYMTRNTLRNDVPINIPVSGGSQNKRCNEVITLGDEKWFSKFYKTLEHNYKQESRFTEVLDQVISPWKEDVLAKTQTTISEFNFIAIERICNYLDIKTDLHKTSMGITDAKFDMGLKDIVKHFEETHYVNAIGGQSLYHKDNFHSDGVTLSFIKMSKLDFKNQYASILDILFTYDVSHIKTQLNKFELI
jgi:hypothetical protein